MRGVVAGLSLAMVARNGVRLGRIAMGPSAIVSAGSVAFVLSVAGCAGEDLVVAGERPRADREDPERDGPDGIDAPPARDVTLLEDCPPSPEERQAAPGCWPTKHIGVWRGFFVGLPRYETSHRALAEFPRGDVLLRLDIDGAGALIFGAPPAGLASGEPPLAPCAPSDVGSSCALGLVIPGFPYRLTELELFDPELEVETRVVGELPRERAERMEFVVRVGEPWDAGCAEREPSIDPRCGGDCPPGDVPVPASDFAAQSSVDGCRCDALGCRAVAPALSISLQMSDDREALRGAYVPDDASLEPASLQFVREPVP